MQPQFVNKVTRDGKVVHESAPKVLNERICSDRTLEIVHGMLQGVVDSGTATNLRSAHFKIAGKTGTAQIARNGSYKQNGIAHQASFVGYFPASAPKYSCIVVVNSPSNSVYYGNMVAGPIFTEIANKIYSNRLELQQEERLAEKVDPRMPVSMSGHANETRAAFAGLGIPVVDKAEGEWIQTISADSVVMLETRGVPVDHLDMVPNVIGMGLKDAIYILENRGYRVRLNGTGMVRKQSLPPGSRARQGATIVIDLG